MNISTIYFDQVNVQLKTGIDIVSDFDIRISNLFSAKKNTNFRAKKLNTPTKRKYNHRPFRLKINHNDP